METGRKFDFCLTAYCYYVTDTLSDTNITDYIVTDVIIHARHYSWKIMSDNVYNHFKTIINQSKTTDDRKSVLKLTDIFPDFIIHGH